MGGVRALAAVLGVAAAIGLCAWGGKLTYDAVDTLTDGARIGNTRTPVPGTTDVELEEGKHVIYYEVDAGSAAGEDPIPIPRLRVRVRRGGDGPPLAVDDYGSNFRVESGGRTAQAAATVRIPGDGRYRIRVSGRPVGADPAVVLGRPVTRRVLRLVLGLAALVAGFALGILVIVLTVVVSLRKRRAAR
jgi:hypothetical protein